MQPGPPLHLLFRKGVIIIRTIQAKHWKVINNPYKDEIEKRMARGESSNSISRWLDTQGAPISHNALNEYRRQLFAFKEEAVAEALTNMNQTLAEKQAETEANFVEGKRRIVDRIQTLQDNVAKMLQTVEILESTYEPKVAAPIIKGFYFEIREHIKLLEQIAGDIEPEGKSSIAVILSDLRKKINEVQ